VGAIDVKTSHTKRPRRRGGRPSHEEAARIRDHILEAATALFFAHGYGAVSIEAVARKVGMSKRTFYHRFKDKAELFKAVMHRIVDGMRAGHPLPAFKDGNLEATLHQLAQLILHASLLPDAIALQRLILAEAARFPELATTVNAVGARQEGITFIASLLEKENKAGRMKIASPTFAAEEFLHMVMATPLRRALGLGKPMPPEELKEWAQNAVHLFLNGCRN
jgi:AcrR family transcriptional regulator